MEELAMAPWHESLARHALSLEARRSSAASPRSSEHVLRRHASEVRSTGASLASRAKKRAPRSRWTPRALLSCRRPGFSESGKGTEGSCSIPAKNGIKGAANASNGQACFWFS